MYGLTVDYLHAVEVVHVAADGRARAVVVSADSKDPGERDLLWANQGGGGGNFGIVTRFWFRGLPSAPTEAWLSSQAWTWEKLGSGGFAGLIHRYGGFLRENSQPGSQFAGLFSLLHLFQQAPKSPEIVLTTQYVGKQPGLLEEFTREMAGHTPSHPAPARIGHHQAPLGDGKPARMPWLFMTQTLNGSGPNRHGKYKSAYMIEPFQERQIDAMFTHLAKPAHPNAAALLQVDSYGCQINAVKPEATAIPQRSSVMKLQYQTYWNEEGEGARNLHWIRGFYEEMYGAHGPRPDGEVDGCYVNYPDVDLRDWEHLYYKDAYHRLQRAKARWDPHDIFRHRQSIKAR